MSGHGPRVAVIGLDAADAGLLLRLADGGEMPTLARFLAEGTAVPTRNPPGLYVGAVWPTLFTGLSPTRHGRYCYEQVVPGGYATRAFDVEDYRREPFWAELIRRGLDVTTADVPKSPPPVAGGTHVQDWGTHDPEAAGFRAWPEGLADEMRSRYGTEPVAVCDEYGPDLGSVRTLLERLLARIEMKTRLFYDLLSDGPRDLFFGVFAESHCAGHQFWHLHDALHPRHDARIVSELGDPLETVYRALDAAVGKVVEALPSQTTVMIVASHGMGNHNDANHLIADMVAAIHTSAARARTLGTLQSAWHGMPRSVRRALQPPLVAAGRWLSRRRAGRPVGLGSALRAPAPSHLPYFAVPNNDSHGALRINLAGREPEGCVQPGDLERVVAELRTALGSYVNEELGRPVVTAIHRIEDLYPGEDVSRLPDLIVDWERSAPICTVRSPLYGRIARPAMTPRSGDHRPAGLLIARGPGIGAGVELESVASIDLAATVSSLLGVARTDLDGHPIATLTGGP